MLAATPGLILHLDRFFHNEQGEISRCTQSVDLNTEVSLPVFQDSSMRTDRYGYIPIAAAAHTGQDLAGHIRTVLKGQPSVTQDGRPVAWMLTEDGHQPELLWKIPTWFVEGVTVVWLVRTDCLALQQLPFRDTENQTENPESSELLQLLQAQPGVTGLQASCEPPAHAGSPAKICEQAQDDSFPTQ